MIRRAHAVQPLTALQSECSLFTRDVQVAILPLLKELWIGFVPFSSLGKRFLLARVDAASIFDKGDIRAGLRRFLETARRANVVVVVPIGGIAAAKGAKPAQAVLAWLLAQGPWIVPISGTTKTARLEEKVGAISIELTLNDLVAIAEMLAQQPMQGERHTPEMMTMVNRCPGAT